MSFIAWWLLKERKCRKEDTGYIHNQKIIFTVLLIKRREQLAFNWWDNLRSFKSKPQQSEVFAGNHQGKY